MMDLDSAIKHCEEVVKIKHNRLIRGDFEDGSYGKEECQKCADEHRQLAEWLKELKAYKEKETCETCGHHKAYQHGADITTMDDECGGCCSWNSKWIPNTCGDAISRQGLLNRLDDFNKWCKDGRLQGSLFAADVIKDMPSVTPQQRTGRWIDAEVLEKIRAEIDEQYDRVHPYNISCAEGLEMALGIIDKYKEESEVDS